jgi:glycine hydroxymethyltransferase
MGSPAMTTRGLVEADFTTISEFVVRAIDITTNIAKEVKGKMNHILFFELFINNNNM